MENKIEIFKNNEFGEVRTLVINDEPWFVGKDVAKILGYSNASKAVSVHVDNEDKLFKMLDVADSQIGNVSKGQSKTALINESGLYSLILSSKLPTARKFKKWVTSEVLPSIRKHGLYALDDVLNNPDFLIKALTDLKAERAKSAELAKTVKELEPKASYADMIMKSKTLMPITTIAKDYGMSGTAMNKLLHGLGIIYRVGKQWVLYNKYQSEGYVSSDTVPVVHTNGEQDFVLHTKWTQKGRMFLYNKLKEIEILPLIEKNIDN